MTDEQLRERLCLGFNAKEIAEQFNLTRHTVVLRIKQLKEKLAGEEDEACE